MTHTYCNLDIRPHGEVRDWSKIRPIVRDIANTYQRDVPDIHIQKAIISTRTEGKSGLQVLQVDLFSQHRPTKPIARYIVRRSFSSLDRTQAHALAEKERRIAKALNTALDERFACKLVESALDTNPGSVIYRLAFDGNPEDAKPFHQVVAHYITAKPDDFNTFVSTVYSFLKDVTQAYDHIFGSDSYRMRNARKHVDGLARLFPPMLIIRPGRISAHKTARQADVTILRDTQRSGARPRRASIAELHRALDRFGRAQLAIRAKCVRQFDRTLCFEDARRDVLWLSLPPVGRSEVHLKPGGYYVISLNGTEMGFLTGRYALERAGFPRHHQLESKDIDPALLKHDIALSTRHGDLHCDNVCSVGLNHKVIDIAGVGVDLAFCDIATLEISLLHHITQHSDLAAKLTQPADMLVMLSALDASDVTPVLALSDEHQRLYAIIDAMRRGVRDAATESGYRNSTKDSVFAYVMALLRYQRLVLQDDALRVSAAASAMVGYWFDKARGIASLRAPKSAKSMRIVTEQNVGAFETLLDPECGRRAQLVEEVLAEVAGRFKPLFVIDHRDTNHALLRTLDDRLQNLMRAVDMSLSGGSMQRVEVPHVLMRVGSIVRLLQHTSATIMGVARLIGQDAAVTLSDFAVSVGVLPANLAALVYLWRYWDRTGGWAQTIVAAPGAEAADEMLWTIELTGNFLRRPGGRVVASAAEASEFWRGYIQGFFGEALRQLRKAALAYPYDGVPHEQMELTKYSAVTGVEHTRTGGDGVDQFVLRVKRLPVHESIVYLQKAREELRAGAKSWAVVRVLCERALTRAENVCARECAVVRAECADEFDLTGKLLAEATGSVGGDEMQRAFLFVYRFILRVIDVLDAGD